MQGSPQGGQNQILYQGIASHAANIGSYIKWVFITIVGGAAAFGLLKIQALSEIPGIKLVWLLTLVGIVGLLYSYLRHTHEKYKVSLARVETEKGIIARDVDSLELWRVLDVDYKQGVLERIMGIATITLTGTDQSDPVMKLRGLPNHRKLFETLRDDVQAARQRGRPMELVDGDMGGGGAMEIT
jgi:membrane protein YdbS with pleckstrin-like domain